MARTYIDGPAIIAKHNDLLTIDFPSGDGLLQIVTTRHLAEFLSRQIMIFTAAMEEEQHEVYDLERERRARRRKKAAQV